MVLLEIIGYGNRCSRKGTAAEEGAVDAVALRVVASSPVEHGLHPALWRWLPGIFTLLVAAALPQASEARAANGGATVLKPGQGVAVSGTDMVCAFGGPANEIGLACLQTSPAAKSLYSFRLEEGRLLVFRSVGGKTARVGGWKEPAGRIAQRRSSTISHFKSVGQVSVGNRFNAAGSDLGCNVYSFKAAVVVACFKLTAKGILNGSYAAALSANGAQVSRFRGGQGTTVFVGNPIR